MKIQSILAVIALLFGAVSQVYSAEGEVKKPFQWKSQKIGKTMYVSFDQMKEFYRFDSLKRNGKKVELSSKSHSLRSEVGTYRVNINGVDLYISMPIKEEAGTSYIATADLSQIIDPVINPAFLAKLPLVTTVVLDPGHGGKDRGAGGLESKHALAVALLAKPMLEKKGFKVVLTRDEDVFVPLRDRVRIANSESNAVFISIHCNAGRKGVRGMETYFLGQLGNMAAAPAKLNTSASISLATALQSRCIQRANNPHIAGVNYAVKDRGVRRAKFNVLAGCKHPAVLLEMGFLSDKEDAAMLNEESFRKIIAGAMVRSVEVFNNEIRRHNPAVKKVPAKPKLLEAK